MHDKIVKQWLKTLHEKLGRGVYAIRTIICILVFFGVSLAVGHWTAKKVQAQSDSPVKPGPQQQSKDSAPAPTTPQSHIPPKKTNSQDNSVHIGGGAKVEQNSSGNCSPNMIGGSGTVNCGPQPRIPDSSVQKLADQLAQCPSDSTMASPSVVNPTGLTDHDATNLASAFAKTHSWGYSGVGRSIHGQDIGPDGPIPDPVGIHIGADQEHLALADCVKAALKSIGVESTVETSKSQSNSLTIVVGNAP